VSGVADREQVDAANAEFWNEPCGTALARSIGITAITPDTLAQFDDAYFEMYPYLRHYVDSLDLAGQRVLEIGVGYGTLGQYIAERAASYAAVDIAEEPVGLLQQRLALVGRPPDRVVQGSALDLPLPDQSVDVVVSIGCLHHTGDLQRAVREVHRVLVPGGTALVMVYNRHSLRRMASAARELLRRVSPRRDRGRADRDLLLRYDANALGEVAPHTDFVSLREAHNLFVAFSTVHVERRNFDAYVVARRFVLDRRWFLGWADRLLGLDLYVSARR
jgi:SAM-dependent methyltransferase